MTVPFERDFDPSDNFPSVVMDALQRMVTATSGAIPCPVRIKPGAANTLQVPAGSGQDAVGLAIAGHWRWNEAAAEQTASGSVGLRDVWACATASDYEAGSPGETDATDRTFVLRVTAADASAPGGFAHTRKIARGVWDGSKWTAVAPIVGGVVGDLLARGKSVVAGEENRTGAAGTMTTADRVSGLYVASDDTPLQVSFSADIKESVANAASVELWLIGATSGANQLAGIDTDHVFGLQHDTLTPAGVYGGIVTDASVGAVDMVLPSQAFMLWIAGAPGLLPHQKPGVITAVVPADTYTVEARYKTSGGATVYARNRKLLARVLQG